MGLALGTGCQIASDCYDLFQAKHSVDLANGTRTFPIVLRLQRQTGEERARFLDLLERAREKTAAQEEVRRRLRAAGELRRCAVIVEIYRQRALRALHEVDPWEPARSGLRMRIDEMRFRSRQP
jgi:geranylgeranyl pyrophosphate synthase